MYPDAQIRFCLVWGNDNLFLGSQVVRKHEFRNLWNLFLIFWIDFWDSLNGQFCAQSSLQLFLDCLVLLTARGHLINILPWSQRKLSLRSFLGHGSLLASEEFLGRQLAFAQASIRETCLQGSSQFGFAPYLCFPFLEI